MSVDCNQCGECCRALVFKIGNLNQVARELYAARKIKIEGDKIIIPHKCPQLNSQGKCMIHEYKPLACKMFPFDKYGRVTTDLLPKGCAFENEPVSSLVVAKR